MDWYMEFNDLMTRGGPVMWVIFITAWLAIVMLCERAIQMQIWLSQAVKDQKAFDNDAHHTPSYSSPPAAPVKPGKHCITTPAMAQHQGPGQPVQTNQYPPHGINA